MTTKGELIEAIDALEADAAWPLIVEFVAEWITEQPGTLLPHVLADRWCEEMEQ